MPKLSAFRALRFSAQAGDPATLLAPPYDVIDPALKGRLRSLSPHNIVHLILPEDGGDERYDGAARLLEQWRGAGVLVSDDHPCVYVYRQTFSAAGRSLSRHALFAAMELSPFGAGEVLPHERTHSGPKRDRLALTLATRVQLSPVFCLARDPAGQLLESLLSAASGAPILRTATGDGIAHELWRLAADRTAANLLAAAGAQPVLVADGHHRYETALEVARLTRESGGSGHVLTCLVSSEDPGLRIRPTHRALSRSPPNVTGAFDWIAALGEAFTVASLERLAPGSAEDVAAAKGCAGLVMAEQDMEDDGGRCWFLEARPTAAERAGLTEAERRIPALVFDRLILRVLFGQEADEASEEGLLTYHRDAVGALRAAGARGRAFYLPAVELGAVWETAARGIRLPPKSTYFEPKVPSGLLLRAL